MTLSSLGRGLLKEHVRQSNAIENINVRENHHLFLDHLAAAEFVIKSVREKVLAKPQEIHRVLMGRELLAAGKFREVRVWVSLYSKPHPENVEKLMKRWQESLERDIRDSRLNFPNPAELAWHYHHWFEAIHPFIDGNGRTGRLILNNIRLLLDLPWLMVLFKDRQIYYDKIRQWEIKHAQLLESD